MELFKAGAGFGIEVELFLSQQLNWKTVLLIVWTSRKPFKRQLIDWSDLNFVFVLPRSKFVCPLVHLTCLQLWVNEQFNRLWLLSCVFIKLVKRFELMWDWKYLNDPWCTNNCATVRHTCKYWLRSGYSIQTSSVDECTKFISHHQLTNNKEFGNWYWTNLKIDSVQSPIACNKRAGLWGY